MDRQHIFGLNKHCLKRVRSRSYSGPHFFAIVLNTEIYRVNLNIQSECGKMRTRKTLDMDNFHAAKKLAKATENVPEIPAYRFFICFVLELSLHTPISFSSSLL